MSKSLWEKIFSAPAKILNETIEIEKEIVEEIKEQKPVKKIKQYWKILGPGLTTGAADDDPSGIATYSQMGASRGLSLLWISLFTFPLMSNVQEMCARIGLVTGSGLATNIRRHYSKTVLYFGTFLLVFANILNIGANLGAMAKSTELLIPQLPFVFLVIVYALIIIFFQIGISYKKYSSYLKYLTLVLFSYAFVVLFIDVDWSLVFKSLIIPKITFDRETILLICAALGTTISPYLFFWQTSQEIEEEILKGDTTEELRREHVNKKDLKNMRLDVWFGMFVSNIVMFFIIIASSFALHDNGVFNINTAEDAANALRPFAGDAAYFLFTIGILGTGFLSIPVLAGSSSYAISEAFNFKLGFNRSLKEASAFYGIIILAIILGIVINFIGIDPIKALIYSAIINGLIAPIMLYLIVGISKDEKIMGVYKNSKLANFVGYITVLFMTIVSVLSIYFLFN